MAIKHLETFFTSRARSAGERLFKQNKVSILQPSDIEIIGRVKPSTNLTLKTASVGSSCLFSRCSCADFKKGHPCKHSWAVLLFLESKASDFLEGKSEIIGSANKEAKPIANNFDKSLNRQELQKKHKALQSEYRKQQYQKQKKWLQQKKAIEQKVSKPETSFPKSIETALTYFLNNGFDLRISLDEDSISRARKKLSRIFHPDARGTHEETVELNLQTDVLLKFVNQVSKKR